MDDSEDWGDDGFPDPDDEEIPDQDLFTGDIEGGNPTRSAHLLTSAIGLSIPQKVMYQDPKEFQAILETYLSKALTLYSFKPFNFNRQRYLVRYRTE